MPLLPKHLAQSVHSFWSNDVGERDPCGDREVVPR
jgi:hypothetical protein